MNPPRSVLPAQGPLLRDAALAFGGPPRFQPEHTARCRSLSLAHSCHDHWIGAPTISDHAGNSIRTRTENPRVVGSIPTLGTSKLAESRRAIRRAWWLAVRDSAIGWLSW